jgi:ribosomal protein S18 acetylase RimI-like enzyme
MNPPERRRSGPGVRIRPARRADAAAVARLANALDAEQGGSGKVHRAASLGLDAFGRSAAVRLIVAAAGRRIVGYAMFGPMYDSDRAVRGSYLNDLYVAPGWRSHGIGRRLVAAVAAATMRRGGRHLWTGVYTRNGRARAFYAALGARDERARIMQIDGPAFARLARPDRGAPAT